MRQSAIIRIVIWSLILLVLLALVFGGVYFKLPIYSFNIGTTFRYQNSNRYSIAEGEVNAGKAQNISVNWVGGNIQVEEYDGEAVVFSETSASPLDEPSKMRYYLQGNNLTIQFCASRRVFPRLDSLQKELLVRVPKGHPLATLDIDSISSEVTVSGINTSKTDIESVSGSVVLSGVTGSSLDMEAVSGSLTLRDSSFASVDAETVSGGIDLEGAFSKIDSETVSGSVTITPGGTASVIDVETVSGGVEILLPEDMDGFSAACSTLSGSFYSDFAGNMREKSLAYGNTRASIDVESLSGSIYIRKQA